MHNYDNLRRYLSLCELSQSTSSAFVVEYLAKSPETVCITDDMLMFTAIR